MNLLMRERLVAFSLCISESKLDSAAALEVSVHQNTPEVPAKLWLVLISGDRI